MYEVDDPGTFSTQILIIPLFSSNALKWMSAPFSIVKKVYVIVGEYRLVMTLTSLSQIISDPEFLI